MRYAGSSNGSSRWRWIVLGAALVAGCGEPPTQVPTRPQEDVGVAAQLSRAVALSLADDRIRLTLKNDLRDSPFSKHRIVLQAYLKGESGRPLAEAVARNMGLTMSRLESVLGAEPALEIFLPNASDRDTWIGSNDFIVAASTVKGVTPAAGYDSRGVAQPLGRFFHSAKERGEGASTSLMIRPTRGMKFRLGRSKEIAGDAVTMRGEGKLAGSHTVYGPIGDSTFGELRGVGTPRRTSAGAATFLVEGECDPETAIIPCEPPGGGGGGGGPTFGIKLARLMTVDMGDGVGGYWAELRFETYLTN